MKYVLYSIWQNVKKTNKEDIPPKYEVCGTAFFSLVYYLMYTIMIICIYSERELLYIVAYGAYIISLVFYLGFLGTGCFKYYTRYMMMVYKYNIVVFVSKYIFYICMVYIFNNYQSISTRNKCIFTLLIEVIFILMTVLIYYKEYKILNNIDSRTLFSLNEKYSIICSNEEKNNIEKAMQIYNKDFCKYIFINVGVICIILEMKFWIIAILYTIVFYMFMLKKYMFTFKVAYKNKGIFMNVICNIVAIIGQILIILTRNHIIEHAIFDYIGWMGIFMLSYIPFMIYYLKLNSLYRRAGCDKNKM